MQYFSSLRAGELAGIKRLDLSCGLTEFPREIFDLADSLEILNLSGNALSSLPDDLPRLQKLRVIFCADNRFTRVPEVLGRCRNLEMAGFKANQINELPVDALPEKLRWLILTDNCLRELPAQLGSCTRLQKLMLAGNQLERLPDELAACSRLELLRIAANRFAHLPDWLFTMPVCTAGLFGNPCSDTSEAAAMSGQRIAHVDWHALELHHKLGEGASGVIYRAHHQEDNSPVAVKMFKGALTSDGLPRSGRTPRFDPGRRQDQRASRRNAGAGDVADRPLLPQPRRTAQPGILHPRHLPGRTQIHAGNRPEHRTRHRLGGRTPARARHHARRPVRAQHPVESTRRLPAGRLRRGLVPPTTGRETGNRPATHRRAPLYLPAGRTAGPLRLTARSCGYRCRHEGIAAALRQRGGGRTTAFEGLSELAGE